MLIITTALACEAKPLISHFNLKRLTDIKQFSVYQANDITLIVTGIGQASATTACSFIYGYLLASDHTPTREKTAWLNIGIAGHSELDIGQCFLANRIVEQVTERVHYPTLVFNSPCPTDSLYTVERASNDYNKAGGIDMEASAFYATVSRFSSSELVHTLKVVSDNPSTPVRKINKNEASDLISQNIGVINTVVNKLVMLLKELSETGIPQLPYDTIVSKYHFTETEKHQLQTKLHKLFLLLDHGEFISKSSIDSLDDNLSAKEILVRFDKLIDQQLITFN